MADNPGIAIVGGFNFIRPGTIAPVFIAPIIGIHSEPSRVGYGAKSERINAPATYARHVQNFGSNKGILIEGWYDLFWKNRVHIIPKDGYALGNIVSPQQRTVEIYNAGENVDHARIVNNIVLTGADGFQWISGTTSTPFTLGAHQSEVYVWEVSEDGAPTLNMLIDFQFADGVSLTNFVTGSRLVLFGFEPQAVMNEVLEWYTDINEKERGIEQRVSSRDIPTRSLTRQFVLDDQESVQLELLLWDWFERQIGLPVWEDQTTLTNSASVSDTSIVVGTTASTEFRAGGLAVIFVDKDQFEAVSIDTVAGTTINLQGPLLGAWPAGTMVMPMNTAVFRDGVQQDVWVADGVRRFVITFDILERFDLASETGFATYLGAPVWEDGLTLRSEQYQRTIGKNIIRGRVGKANPNFVHRTLRTQAYTEVQGFTIYVEDRAELQRLRGWLHARRGRQKAFWLPTSKKDLSVDVDQVGTNNEIEVKTVGYERFIEANPGGRRDIRIEYVDGSVIYRRITGSELTVTGERLFLSSNTTQLVTAANVARISFMLLVRQDLDKLSIEHFRLDDAIVNIPLKEVVES